MAVEVIPNGKMSRKLKRKLPEYIRQMNQCLKGNLISGICLEVKHRNDPREFILSPEKAEIEYVVLTVDFFPKEKRTRKTK